MDVGEISILATSVRWIFPAYFLVEIGNLALYWRCDSSEDIAYLALVVGVIETDVDVVSNRFAVGAVVVQIDDMSDINRWCRGKEVVDYVRNVLE